MRSSSSVVSIVSSSSISSSRSAFWHHLCLAVFSLLSMTPRMCLLFIFVPYHDWFWLGTVWRVLFHAPSGQSSNFFWWLIGTKHWFIPSVKPPRICCLAFCTLHHLEHFQKALDLIPFAMGSIAQQPPAFLTLSIGQYCYAQHLSQPPLFLRGLLLPWYF